MQAPLISVIIPVYNVEKYLNKCVESVVNQTYKNLEIILVDDGSPDHCPQMCDDWAQKDARIKVIHKQNGGVSSARNEALNVALGEYIGFVDSDDIIKPNMFEILCKAIDKSGSDICLCNNAHLDEKLNTISVSHYKAMTICNEDVLTCFLKGSLFDSTAVWNKLFRYKLIENYNIRFDEKITYGEDYLFNYFAFKRSTGIVLVNDVLYGHITVHPTSVTNQISQASIQRWKVVKKILNNERNDCVNYQICLCKYASELLCVMRELLRSNNMNLIQKCYWEIVDEIKLNFHEFMRSKTIRLQIKLFVIVIRYFPGLFKFLYKKYYFLKNNSIINKE